MSEAELTRVRSDLDVMQRAMGLHMPFTREVLVYGSLLAITAMVAAIVSLRVEADWVQVVLPGAIILLGLLGVCARSCCRACVSREMTMQGALSVSVYSVVWVAACGYTLATFLGPTVGIARTVVLNVISIGILFAFTLLLVRAAFQNRERSYCLGLAISTLLAGMLFPVLDRHYSYPLAHCFMAVGLLAGVAIQWVQLRKAVTHYAAD